VHTTVLERSYRSFVLTATCALAIASSMGIGSASAQKLAARAEPEKMDQAASPSVDVMSKRAHSPREQRPYYVDFRARTAASYGHAFVWYGRTSDPKVEVAGLHPASESVVPYILGHVLPVPSETGASYGDLDAQYLQASYRVYLTEPEAKRVFAYIKHLQDTSPIWNAVTYNCTAFIGDIAKYMGLKTPITHLMYPENWVNNLREINNERRTAQLAPEKLDANASVR
jgi:hypothetical protein